MTYRPPLCSEREPGGYEDCTWASGVMLQNAAHGRVVVPSTRTEYEALRVAGGDGPAENPGDGSNISQLQLGFTRRYDWTPPRIGVPGLTRATFAEVWGLLDPGFGGVLQGRTGAFPAGNHYRRWDVNFTGGHAVYVQREDAQDRVWWMDPLAPSTYSGEWMSKADLRRYFEGLYGGLLHARIGRFALPDTGTEDIVTIFSAPGLFSMAWPTGSPIYAGPTGAATGKTGATRRYLVVGQNLATSPTRYLVDGAGDGASGKMGWLDVAGGTARQVETFNAGIDAAINAASAAKR